MSDIFGVTGAAIAAFGPLIGDVIADFALIASGPYHALGTLIPHIVTEENHRDDMVITQHPVEVGAPITDHAFMQPYSVQMHAFWSDSTAGVPGYVQSVYEALLAQQATRQPFEVITGKRAYSGMLMKSLAVKTDAETWSVLDVLADCQQIIIVSSQGGGPAPTAPTDGGSTVATYPTIASDGNAGSPSPQGGVTISGDTPVPPGAIQPDANGNIVWPNTPAQGGPQTLQAAPAGTPTVESLTANQGV